MQASPSWTCSTVPRASFSSVHWPGASESSRSPPASGTALDAASDAASDALSDAALDAAFEA